MNCTHKFSKFDYKTLFCQRCGEVKVVEVSVSASGGSLVIRPSPAKLVQEPPIFISPPKPPIDIEEQEAREAEDIAFRAFMETQGVHRGSPEPRIIQVPEDEEDESIGVAD
jgi:hypothetical protein